MTSNYPIVLEKILDSFLKGYKVTQFILNKESKEYFACSFLLNEKSVEFRLSKITPKKCGAFVTIWKRNHDGVTTPFDDSDNFDFIIITCKKEDKLGAFIFPKSVLIAKKIISSNGITGKRGIRVYPSWDLAENPQAKKTQMWQLNYFTQLAEEVDYLLVEKLLKS